jgi:hypothetical protein
MTFQDHLKRMVKIYPSQYVLWHDAVKIRFSFSLPTNEGVLFWKEATSLALLPWKIEQAKSFLTTRTPPPPLRPGPMLKDVFTSVFTSVCNKLERLPPSGLSSLVKRLWVKPWTYPRVEHFTRVDSSRTHKHLTWLDRPAREIYFSLLRTFVYYVRKSFITMAPRG